MVQIYPSHLTFYNISDNGVNPYPFASHPDNSTLDIFSFPLPFKNHPSFISIYIGAADISYHFEPLAEAVNDGLLDQFRGKGELYSSLNHLILWVFLPKLSL